MTPYEKKAQLRIQQLSLKDEESDCILWIGAVGGKNDYPSMHYKGQTARATRVIYELTYGDIPKGLYICHKCDNPICVNPSHLFLGTQKHNMQDASRKGRVVIPNLKGEDHANAMLSNANVIRFRKEYQAGRKLIEIQKEAGYKSRSTTQAMLWGRTYKELPLFPRTDRYMNVKKKEI